MDKKRGCLWAVGAAVGGFLLLAVLLTLVNGGEHETANAPVSTNAETQAVIDALKAARRLDADDGAAALETVEAAWADLSENEAAWVRAGYAVAATRIAVEAGERARAASAVASDMFRASPTMTRELCIAGEEANFAEAKARVLFDLAAAAWSGEPVEVTDLTTITARSIHGYDLARCYEMEPLELGPGGSSDEPDLSFEDAVNGAGFFLGTCARRVSALMPPVEQQTCFTVGSRAFRFLRSWIPNADVAWRNAPPDRRTRMEAQADDLEQRLRSTLDTLGWMQGVEPRFEPRTLGR